MQLFALYFPLATSCDGIEFTEVCDERLVLPNDVSKDAPCFAFEKREVDIIDCLIPAASSFSVSFFKEGCGFPGCC